MAISACSPTTRCSLRASTWMAPPSRNGASPCLTAFRHDRAGVGLMQAELRERIRMARFDKRVDIERMETFGQDSFVTALIHDRFHRRCPFGRHVELSLSGRRGFLGGWIGYGIARPRS